MSKQKNTGAQWPNNPRLGKGSPVRTEIPGDVTYNGRSVYVNEKRGPTRMTRNPLVSKDD